MKKLRGGLIGCGYFAQFHIEAWRRMEDVELVAAADPDLDRARRAAAHAYPSAEQMLDREALDFVDIATRPETHLDLVKLACSRGVPVICQKPMAPSWEDAVAMAETAGRARVPLMIHENWRFQPWYRELKARLEGGDIGAVVSYRFRIRKRDGHGTAPYAAQPYFRQMPRLLIHETLVHPIDTARYLFGEMEAVYAQAARRNPVIAGEDVVHMVVTHTAPLAGEIDGHRFTDLAPDSPPLGDTCVEGEGGVLMVTPSGDLTRDGRLVWENRVTEGYRGDSVRATARHFAECLRQGCEFETSARRYLGTVAAVEAAYRSAEEGRRVKIVR